MKSEFEKLGYEVIGVSKDKVESQQKFIEARQLTVPIITDDNGELCKKFNIGGLLLPARTTVVIDEDLNVIKRYEKVKVPNHAISVLVDLGG